MGTEYLAVNKETGEAYMLGKGGWRTKPTLYTGFALDLYILEVLQEGFPDLPTLADKSAYALEIADEITQLFGLRVTLAIETTEEQDDERDIIGSRYRPKDKPKVDAMQSVMVKVEALPNEVNQIPNGAVIRSVGFDAQGDLNLYAQVPADSVGYRLSTILCMEEDELFHISGTYLGHAYRNGERIHVFENSVEG